MSVATKSDQPAVSGPSPARAVVEALRGLWDKAQQVFFRVIQPNRTYYYTYYYGTNNVLLLFLKNLIRPKWFLTKFAYGQVIPFPPAISKGDPLPAFTPSEEAVRIMEQLKRDGLVILPGRFREIADHVTAKYNIAVDKYKPADEYQYEGDVYLRQIDRKILEFMADELVLEVFGLYWNRQPYLRAPVQLSLCYPNHDQKSTRETFMRTEKLNMGWHYDTPNMLQIAVLLNDVTEKDSHMQVAKGEHRVHRVPLGRYDYYYSEEWMQDHCETMRCVGPKGTIYFFDSNAMHRLWAVKNSPRFMLKVMYMPGNDILPVKHPHIDYRISAEGGLNLDGFTPLQKNALRHLI